MSIVAAGRLGHSSMLIVPVVCLLASHRTPPVMHVERLAPNVYAVIRDQPIGLAQNANSLIVVGDSSVVVVDAQFTREATLATLAEIRRITRLPVGWVINTHWHDDHLAGNQVYRDSFPSVRIVQHANTVTDLETLGRRNRRSQVEGMPGALDRFERLLAAGLGGDSTPASNDERAALTAAIGIARRYVAEAPEFREIVATDTVQGRLRIGRGRNAVDVAWYGCANTRGDLVVLVPAARVVATGDLVVWPVPFGFGSYPASWASALDSVLALHPRVLVPGHGPVMRDDRYVRRVRGMLGLLVGGATRLDAERSAVPLDAKWRDFLFDGFFMRPVMQAIASGRSC